MKKEIKKVPVYLFSKDCPGGEMFSFYGGKESDEYKNMIEEGWVDTPAKLDLPKEMNTGITEEMAVNADPQHLIGILEKYGFIVLTPEQLKIQAGKMADVALDMENFSDEDIIHEAERRGLKQSEEVDVDGLKVKFLDDPKTLSREELFEIGKDINAGLRSNWSDEVLVEKIAEKLKEV